MIVRLEAFGGKLSGEMEWPDDTRERVHLMLDFDRFGARSIDAKTSVRVLGTFQHSGIELVDVERQIKIPVYVLVEIGQR